MPARPRKATPPPAKPKQDFAKLLAGAKLPECTVAICLRGDLNAEHESLDRQLGKLIDTPVTKFGGDGRGELQQRIRDLEAEMEASTAEFRLRALPRREWRELVAKHQPRIEDGKVNETDAALGINTETFFEPMVRRCLVDPEVDDEQWFQLTEALTSRQFDTLWDASWSLNRRDVDVPFSFAAWRQNQPSLPE